MTNNDSVLCAEFNYPCTTAFWFAWRMKNSESVCCHQLRLFFTVRWELNNSTILSSPLCFHCGPILLCSLQQTNISAFWKPMEFSSTSSPGLSTKLAKAQNTSLVCIMCPWKPMAYITPAFFLIHSKLPCFILYLFESVSQIIYYSLLFGRLVDLRLEQWWACFVD